MTQEKTCIVCNSASHPSTRCEAALRSPHRPQKAGETEEKWKKAVWHNAYIKAYYARNREDLLKKQRARDKKGRMEGGKRHQGQLRASRKRYAKKREWLNGLKAKPCMDCGGSFPPECMDFDHRPDEKKLFVVGQNVSRGKEAVLAEIAKCDLVCANCHRVRTYARLDRLDD